MRHVSIPGGWTERDVELGDRTLRLLLPADPDEFVNQLEGEDEAKLPRMRSDPYWAKVWQAAPLFVAAILRATWPLTARILELGCGIGVPGFAASVRGYRVTLSDYVGEAVELALENARRNELDAIVTGRTLDWFDPPQDNYDVVLASDVTYDPRLHEPLLKTIDAVMGREGEAWIADPGRARAREFAQAARRFGFQVEIYDERSQRVEDFVVAQFRRTVLRRRRGA